MVDRGDSPVSVRLYCEDFSAPPPVVPAGADRAAVGLDAFALFRPQFGGGVAAAMVRESGMLRPEPGDCADDQAAAATASARSAPAPKPKAAAPPPTLPPPPYVRPEQRPATYEPAGWLDDAALAAFELPSAKEPPTEVHACGVRMCAAVAVSVTDGRSAAAALVPQQGHVRACLLQGIGGTRQPDAAARTGDGR
jgi:hypothetical protein